ncbi:hypothetical protein MBT84_42325 [Streptomyces sp. MBT84]|nr:hypothetical protein [Streptomyces sp. MBT84]
MAPFARPGGRRTGPVSPVPTSANGTGGTRRPVAAPRYSQAVFPPVRRPPRHGEPPPRLGVSGRRPVTPNVRPGPRNRTSGATTRRPTVCRRFPRRRLRRPHVPSRRPRVPTRRQGTSARRQTASVHGLRRGLPRNGAVRVVFPPLLRAPRLCRVHWTAPSHGGQRHPFRGQPRGVPASSFRGGQSACGGAIPLPRPPVSRLSSGRERLGARCRTRPGPGARPRQHRRRGLSADQGSRGLVPARILW